MKNIFRISLIVAALLAFIPASAQIRLGIKGGANLSTKAGIANPPSAEVIEPLSGWQLGLLADINISSKFTIQPSLIFITKGNKLFSPIYLIGNTNANNDGVLRYSIRPHYIEVPVLVLFKTDLNELVKFYGGIGPYLGVAVGGNITADLKSLTETHPLAIDKNPHYRRFDYGLSGTVGLEFNHHWQVGIGYDFGLVDVNGIKAVNFKSYNRSLSMTVGFFL